MLTERCSLLSRARRHSVVAAWLVSTALVSAQTARADDRFVDQDATATTQDGRSWDTAWRTFAAIDWSAVHPGDTVWIAEGDYRAELRINAGGTPGAPVTIRVAQDSAHAGMVTVAGIASNRDWLTIDGAADDAFATSITSATSVPNVARNIRLRSTAMVNLSSDHATGLTLKWVEISAPDVDGAFGVRLNPSSVTGDVHVEIAYVWVHDVGQDAITLLGNRDPSWDDFVVHHSLLERPGDDGMEIAAGSTVHDCIIRSSRAVRGHPDGIQATGNYHRYYNNIIYDFSSSLLITQGTAPEGGDYGHIQIYGNAFFIVERPCATTELELKWYPVTGYERNTVFYRDWLIANNTFAFLRNGGITVHARQDFVQNIHVREFRVQNNVFHEFRNNVFKIPWGHNEQCDPRPCVANDWDYTESDVLFDHNVVASSVATGRHVVLGGTVYDDVNALGTATGWDDNSASPARFVDAEHFDFRLAAEDTVARDTGVDLSGLDLPGLERDLAGNRRGADGHWDRGALEQGECPPICGLLPDGGVQADAGDDLRDAGRVASNDAGPADEVDAAASGGIDAGSREADAGASDRMSAHGSCGCRIAGTASPARKHHRDEDGLAFTAMAIAFVVRRAGRRRS